MKIKLSLFLLIAMVIGLSLRSISVQAADPDVATTITVDSIGDSSDANIADDICDDGSGNCTLRAAIEESNNTPGTQNIEFAIVGPGVHTIAPGTLYPAITDVVHINGYSQNQTGSVAVENTAVAPAALNSTIMIEINGSAVDSFLIFSGGASGSAGSSVRGLAINRFTGTAIHIVAQDVTIAGNYIGTAADGLTDMGNGFAGITNAEPRIASSGAIIGGLNPEDRNIISGNESAAIYPRDNWVIQGNYIGVDRTGMTKLANSVFGPGAGGLSIDDCTGVVVGGSEVGAVNVISGNNNQGIAPDRADDLVIQGNYIGVGADGVTSIPNDAMGIDIKASDNALIGGSAAGEGNIINNNGLQGIYFDNGVTNSVIQGNLIANNDDLGVLVLDSSSIAIGGSATGEGNTIEGNATDGVYLSDSSSAITIQGNNINGNGSNGVVFNNSSSVTIGGSAVGEGNLFDSNTLYGIDIQTGSFDITLEGNEITSSGNDGVRVDNTDDITMSFNNISQSGQHGINIQATEGVTIESNDISQSAQSGIVVQTTQGLTIEGNDVSQSTQDGVSIQTTDGVIIDDNLVADNDSEGIVVDGTSTSLEITNNVSDSNGSYGISLLTGQTGALISRNTITNAVSQGGIIGNDIDDSIIDTNIVEDNEFVGIVITTGSTGNTISNNQVARNLGTGVNIAGGSTNNQVIANDIFDNSSGGINIDNSNDNVIGGSTVSDRNVIYGHASSNINISGFGGISNGNVVQGNFIGVPANGQPDSSISQASGVSLTGSAEGNLVGGTGSGEGNRIVGNTVSGIQSTAITITGLGSFTPSSNTFIGNAIYGTEAGSINGFGAPGLGIELLNINVDGSFVPQSADSDGPDVNDASDADTGTNNYMNYPVINSASQNLLELDVNFDLDAADSPSDQYRVEFFANDSADPSGYGEGQTYLGATTVNPGVDRSATLTLSTGTNLTGKVLSATTTAVDGTSASGFGSTSEFSLVSDIDIIALPQEQTTVDSILANTGQNIIILFTIAAGLCATALIVARRRYGVTYSLRN